MKNKTLYILTFLILTSSLSNSQIVFDTIAGNSNIKNEITAIIRIQSNRYLMSETKGNYPDLESSFFVCSEDGLIQNYTNFPQYNSILIINKIISKNNEYLFLGITGKTSYNKLCLFSYDNNLNFQWYKEFCLFEKDTTINFYIDYAVNKYNEIVIMGSSYENVYTHRSIFTFKTNFNADSLFFKKNYGTILTNRPNIYTIDTIPNTEKYLVASNEFNSSNFMECNITKLNNTLNVENIFTPLPLNNATYDNFWGNSQIKFYNDTSFLSVSRKLIYNSSSQEEEICLQHYDTAFNLIKEVSWGADGNSIDYFSYWGLDFIEKSAVYIGGTSPINRPNNYMMLTKLDENLDIIWTKFYGGDANYRLDHTIATEDGGCLIVGECFYPDTMSYNDIIILKVDAGGNTSLPTGVKKNYDSLVKDIIVYPNPTMGILNIRKGQQIKNSTIKIYDLNGILIKKMQLHSDFSTINLTNNKKGTYIYEIISNNKIIDKNKIILLK